MAMHLHSHSPDAPAPPGQVHSRDPRCFVTQDALRVAPELLGLPLARPWRRVAAMSIDGLLIAMLSNAPSVLFGFAAALVLFRVSARSAASGGGYLSRSFRWMLRFGAAMLLFGVSVSGWDSVSERIGNRVEASFTGGGAAQAGSRPPRVVEGAAGLRMATDLLALRGADDPAAARERALRAAAAMRDQGMDTGEIDEALRGIAASAPDRPWLAAAVDSALRSLRVAEEAPPADSVVGAYVAAFSAGDAERADGLRPLAGASLARDTIARLNERIGVLHGERARLRSRVESLEQEAERGGSFLQVLRELAGDLGLGLGWSGLYFTAAVALWKGQTPGKRLLGIRIVRLNGRPVGWWAAFERFGGYAAGVATGLLGFLQVYWDNNRQAIHDKIAGTVVIRG